MKIIGMIFCHFLVVNCAQCQSLMQCIKPYVENLSTDDKVISETKLYELIKEFAGNSSILILSEDIHNYQTIEKTRTDLLLKLSEETEFKRIFLELSIPDIEIIKRLRDFENTSYWFSNAYYCDSNQRNKEFFEYFDKDRFYVNPFLAKSSFKAIYGLDIGLSSFCLAFEGLLRLTKDKFLNGDSTSIAAIDFVASVNPIFFHKSSMATPSPNELAVLLNKVRIIINGLENKVPGDKILIRMWSNIEYILVWGRQNLKTNFHYKLSSTYDMSLYYRYRDSIMAENFFWWHQLLGDSSRSLISVSTYHSLGGANKYEVLKQYRAPEVKTFGDFLNSRFSPGKITRVAMIALDFYSHKKLRIKKMKNRKKSLEWHLAKNYSYAFVNFRKMREDGRIKHLSFYMSPTFYEYLYLPWHQLLDGVIFIRDIYKYKVK